ncbi:MAG: heavy-metal-associated domain-containing protein [Chloroflexi bacterium]|nr:heavy-metal-associated domain-containing protein [Chloroflexota bacterium]
MVTRQTWIIDGERTMHCAGCAQTVKFSIARLPEVVKIQADHRTQLIHIDVEAPTADFNEHILTELNNLGYTARQVDDETLTDNQG